MNPMYYQPWSLVDRWPRELEQLFSGGLEPAVTERAASTPAVDIQEENDRFVVRAGCGGEGH